MIEIIGALECLESCRSLQLLDEEGWILSTSDAGNATDYAGHGRECGRITLCERRLARRGKITWNVLVAVPGGRIV